MKHFFLTITLCFSIVLLKAQNENIETKVVSKKYKSVVGYLQKVNVEGLALKDYNCNYIIFKPNDIVKIKVRKRGLTIAKGAASLSVTGLGLSLCAVGLSPENTPLKDMALAVVVGTGGGALVGAIGGLFAEVKNTKLIMLIDGNEEKFKANYKKLEKYVSNFEMEQL